MLPVGKLFDTKTAAKRLKVSERRVRVFCEEGRLGMRLGGRWVITETELRAFKPNPSGWPKGRKRASHRRA